MIVLRIEDRVLMPDLFRRLERLEGTIQAQGEEDRMEPPCDSN